MVANNSGSMLGMFSTHFILICFFEQLKFVFCNAFIGSFDCWSIVFGLNRYS